MTKRLPLPRLVWHCGPGGHADDWASVVIATLRALAAIEVVAAHLRALSYPGMRSIANPSHWFQGFAFLTGFAHQAVLLFFVISGWLVGGSLLDKWYQPSVLRHYAIDRLSRLWTVLIPILLLNLALAAAGGHIDSGTVDVSPENPYSASVFIGNLLGLQLISVPSFGDNFPLWSLSNETWYYVIFPLLILLLRTNSLFVRTGCALGLAALALFLPPTLLLFFAIWLLGAASSRLQIHCGSFVRCALVAALLGFSIVCRLYGYNDDLLVASFKFDLPLSALFVVVLCSLQGKSPPARPATLRLTKLAGFFAEFSFTLYVIHMPLIHIVQQYSAGNLAITLLSPHELRDFLLYLAVLSGITVFAWLFSRLFECQTPTVRRWLKRRLLSKAARHNGKEGALATVVTPASSSETVA